MPRITAAQVAALTDAKSFTAAKKVANPTGWATLGDAGARLWGTYNGSESYSVYADVTGSGECSCPSNKSPCKHVLGLLLLEANGHVFPVAELPAGHASAARYSSTWE